MSNPIDDGVLVDITSMCATVAGVAKTSPDTAEAPVEEGDGKSLSMAQFIEDFGDGLLEQVKYQNPPIYDTEVDKTTAVWAERQAIMDGLKRKPFPAQAETVQAAVKLLLDQGERAAVLNCDMGTGKTMMAICAAAIIHQTAPRTIVISPPHLVYKWRREILQTVPNAKVWVLNGPDTLRKLLAIRSLVGTKVDVPEFFVLGRVRMRMGFHWEPAFITRKLLIAEKNQIEVAACPDCMMMIERENSDGDHVPISAEMANVVFSEKRCKCDRCGSSLWTLKRPGKPIQTKSEMVLSALKQIPTIGEKTAQKLLGLFGEELLSQMLADNLYDFVNLMDHKGELVFTDRQAKRMERALATFEFSVGEGGYQATEFIKRYMPPNYFGLLVVDEGHEYKNDSSAQGQAMGVLATQCKKTLLLTGTLMGGYADDLFHLLWRIDPSTMVEDGFKPNERGSMATAAMQFMRQHGILKDVYKETGSSSHKTAKGKQMTVRTSKAPGFGPVGIMRYVVPITVFLKLRDIGQNVLPSYDEHFIDVPMSDDMEGAYKAMSSRLLQELKQALVLKDNSLLGVVMNVLLAWPECCFRHEVVRHPRTKALLYSQPAVVDEATLTPKEEELIRLVKQEKAQGRKVLVYSIYSGTRDTQARLKSQLEQVGCKVGVLRSTVDASRREDWVADQVERGIDVLICNPELVKTGLDLLDFPTIVFMQSGYNVYTLMQAARRSWRIGQKNAVRVYFLGYQGSSQVDCLKLMAKKIAVTQSTSGDMPDCGLDVLNDSGDSIEVALAKKLLEG